MFDETTQYESTNKRENEFLELIDQSVKDPLMERVIKKAQDANDMLKIMPLTKEGRAQLMSDLDTEWSIYRHAGMTITGSGSFQSADGPVDVVFDGLNVRSNGFYVQELSETLDETLSNAEVVYDFLVNPSDLPGQKSEGRLREILVKLDNVVIETTAVSPERAIAWLQLAYPDFIAEIDRRIVNTPSESDALLALRSLDIDAFVDMEDPLARNCVDKYITTLVQMDFTAPYGLYINGRVAVESATHEEQLMKKDRQRVLAYLSQISLRLFVNPAAKTKRWVPMIGATILPMDRRGDTEVWQIPLSSINNLYSVRSSFYSD